MMFPCSPGHYLEVQQADAKLKGMLVSSSVCLTFKELFTRLNINPNVVTVFKISTNKKQLFYYLLLTATAILVRGQGQAGKSTCYREENLMFSLKIHLWGCTI